MITPDDILAIANRAAAGVYRRWPDVIPWNDSDWEDARQAAAEGVVRAIARYAATHSGYLCVAAKQAATRWLWRERLGRSVRDRDTTRFNSALARFEPRDTASWFTDEKQILIWSILAKRKRNPQREADIDLQILDYLLAGVSHREIARMIGLTPNALRVRRQRIQERLRRYMEQEDCHEDVC